MDQLMKNIETATVLPFAGLVDYAPGQVASKTLAQNDAVSLTLFAFAKGEEISTHESHGDALVIALDGIGEITIDGEKHPLRRRGDPDARASSPRRLCCGKIQNVFGRRFSVQAGRRINSHRRA